MAIRVFKIVVIIIAAILLLYISRFWPVELWPRRGALADLGLRAQGGMLAYWLRGTPLAPFELVIWVVLTFTVLTGLDRLFTRLDTQMGKDD